MPTFSRRTLSIRNIQLSYLEQKLGEEPLLLLHGMGDHALVWSSLAEYLGDRYHIIAPDLRGHGDSSKPKQGYTFPDVIADLDALLEHLGWQQVHVLGHSWGAKTLLIWAQQSPELFQSLILVDPFFNGKLPQFVNISFPLLYRILPFLSGMGPFDSYEEAKKRAPQLNQYQGWSDLQQQVFREGLEQKNDGQWGTKFTVEARNEIFAESIAMTGLNSPITIPTLYIQPQRGMNKRSWQLQPYRCWLQNLQWQTVPGNHWPFLGEPDRFNQVVADFLATQAPVSQA